MPPKVEIYTKNFCGYCRRARSLLEEKDVPFQEYLVENDPEKRRKMVERTGGPWTLPQVFINDRLVGGWDALSALELAGRLDELLKEE